MVNDQYDYSIVEKTTLAWSILIWLICGIPAIGAVPPLLMDYAIPFRAEQQRTAGEIDFDDTFIRLSHDKLHDSGHLLTPFHRILRLLVIQS